MGIYKIEHKRPEDSRFANNVNFLACILLASDWFKDNQLLPQLTHAHYRDTVPLRQCGKKVAGWWWIEISTSERRLSLLKSKLNRYPSSFPSSQLYKVWRGINCLRRIVCPVSTPIRRADRRINRRLFLAIYIEANYSSYGYISSQTDNCHNSSLA